MGASSGPRSRPLATRVSSLSGRTPSGSDTSRVWPCGHPLSGVEGAGELFVGGVAEEDESRFGDVGLCVLECLDGGVGGGGQRPAVDTGGDGGERDGAGAE